MRKILFLFIGLLFLSSCEWYDDVDVIEIGKIKLDQLQGTNAKVNIDVELFNPNFYAISIKPSTLDVYIEDEFVGKAQLLEKVKFKRKSTGIYNMKVELLGEAGILKKTMRYMMMKELKVRVVGKVKGSVMGISKKMAVDKTKTIDGSKLRIDIPFFN
jgi:LEA14-like dessication related protein